MMHTVFAKLSAVLHTQNNLRQAAHIRWPVSASHWVDIWMILRGSEIWAQFNIRMIYCTILQLKPNFENEYVNMHNPHYHYHNYVVAETSRTPSPFLGRKYQSLLSSR